MKCLILNIIDTLQSLTVQIEFFSVLLTKFARKLEIQFFLAGESISAEEVFHPEGLLAPFLERAEQLASFCLEKSLGIEYQLSSNSRAGKIPILTATTVPNSLRLLCVMEIIQEMLDNSGRPLEIELEALLTG